ncbi:MAG: choice-of-anchor P family protein, partial [Acidobacteriota bacterium]
MLGRLFTFLLAVIGLVLLGTIQTNAQRYSGRATAIRATVGIPGINPLTTAINDTGELPSGGGTITLASASTSIANAALTAGTSSSTTSGGTPAGTSHAMASVQNLNFSVLGNTITAASISTVTDCVCPAQTCTGRTVLVGLTLNGVAVNITGDANQTILLTGPLGNTVGTLILDEQLFGSGSKTVNGLHLHVADSATGLATDVVISSSHSDILCVTDATDNFFSGRAYGLGSILTTDTLLAGRSTVALLVDDTGPLPDSGGFIGPVVVAGATLPGLLTTGTLVSSTSGGTSGANRVSDSSSNVQTLNATVAGFGITATVLTSQTHCQCGLAAAASTCTGGAVITNLLITTPIGGTITGTVNANPNNTITLNVAGIAVATIITNQQIPPS